MLSTDAAGATTATAPVPLTRLDFADPELLEELLGAVRDVAERGAFTLGEPVEAFEREFAEYCETDFSVGVSSGTDALVLALRALEIGPGDEVLVPANSFIATAEAVSLVGASPRFVDVDPESHLITPKIVERNLSPNVRCLIPVHLFGATVEMDAIMALAREAGVHVVEDACQAHGARHRGQRVGSFGAIGCFSFYPTKNLGAWGDGGALVTGVPELAERLRLLRAHGEQPRYRHRMVGTTARLDALQASVLRVKLRRLEDWNEQRRRRGAELRALIVEGLLDTDREGLIEPPTAASEHGDHVYHLFVVRSDERDALRDHLTRLGVASAIHYPTPIHLTEAYAGVGMQPGSLPVSERLAERMCSLAFFPAMTEAETRRVAQAVIDFAQDRRVEDR